MKIFATIITFFLLFTLFPNPVFAKVLPQARSSGKAVAPRAASSGTNISVSPRLRGDRKALLISFGSLQNATNVSYALYYSTLGREEGAGGSVRKEEGSSASRELLFGTCSKNVCTYHQSIKNMKFEVTGTLKSGKTFLKRYRIRI
ncbi:MAG: hypothetical protein HYV39_01875 [Candidatus Levybacteria bacterium]|nr:hypothetical protein [Candidatus Levybacteria bacterium]